MTDDEYIEIIISQLYTLYGVEGYTGECRCF
jgi:hypothetical protein